MGNVKSLARPGRIKATATKIGIHSAHPQPPLPRSSTHFLVRCSNFCKPLKRNSEYFRPTRSPRQQWPSLRTKNWEHSIVFSVQGTGDSSMGSDPENKVCDQDTGSPGRPVSSGLQVPSEAGYCRARTRPPWWIGRGVFPSNYTSFAPAEMSSTRVDSLALWKIIYEGNAVLISKNWGENFSSGFCTGNFLGHGGVSRYAPTPFIVALSPGHSDITMFRLWSPIATENYLDRAENIPNIAQNSGNFDVFDPRSGISGPTSRRAATCPNLHERWTQPAHVRCPVVQLLT